MKYIGKHNAFDELLIGPVLFTFPDAASFYQLTLPVDDGSSGQVLATDGNGVLSWVANGVAVPNALTIGVGVDLASGNTSWDGSAAETLNLDLTEVIATDGANRLLTSDGDGTLTAEPNFTYDGSLLTLSTSNISQTYTADGGTDYAYLLSGSSGQQNNSTLVGLSSCLTRSGNINSGQTTNVKGLYMTVDDYASGNIGNSNLYGIHQIMSHSGTGGDTASYGVNTTIAGGDLGNNIGLYQNIADGGLDLKFVSSADTGDYFSISTTTHGATTFTTLDDNATAADLIFSPDGDAIFNILDANPNSLFKISIAGGTNHFLEVSGEDGNYSRFKMYEQGGSSTDDYFNIDIQEHGETVISTVDNAATAANLTLDIDGDITLDADGGTIEFKDDGTGRFRFNLDATPEIDVTGDLTIDCTGTIELNADGNSIMFKDGSTEVMEVTSTTLKLISMQGLSFEGTPDSYETIIDFIDPTADRTITLPNASGTVALTSAIPTVPTDTVTTGAHIHTQTKVTIDATACNGLSSSPVTLVAAQGADTIIVPVSVTVLLDRNSADSSGADLIVGYNGTTNYQYAIRYMRRFMLGITTDMQFNMVPYFNGHGANSLTGGTNVPLTMSTSAPITAGSLTSMVVYTSYYVIDK